MALSMDEQRMLAEIERRLSAEDPKLAVRLSSFKRPARFKSPRVRIIGSLFTLVLLAVISMMVYAMVPFRAHGPKTTTTNLQASTPGVSAPAHAGQVVGSAPRAGTRAGAGTGSTVTGTSPAPKISTLPRTGANTAVPVNTAAK